MEMQDVVTKIMEIDIAIENIEFALKTNICTEEQKTELWQRLNRLENLDRHYMAMRDGQEPMVEEPYVKKMK